MLLSVTTDLHALSAALYVHGARLLEGCLDPEDVIDLLNLLGLGQLLPQRAPLEPGWQMACSGMYSLDLAVQVRPGDG